MIWVCSITYIFVYFSSSLMFSPLINNNNTYTLLSESIICQNAFVLCVREMF